MGDAEGTTSTVATRLAFKLVDADLSRAEGLAAFPQNHQSFS
jgi:hypothetical protein